MSDDASASLAGGGVSDSVLRLDAAGDGRGLGPLDLEVRSSEIVGVAGVEGNGQVELAVMLAEVLVAADGAYLSLAQNGLFQRA